MDANGFSTPDLPPALLALGQSVLEGNLADPPTPGWPEEGDLASAAQVVAPYCADRTAMVQALERAAGRYLPAAERWVAEHAGHPWIAPFTRDGQGWVATGSADPPAPADFTPQGTMDHTPFGCTPIGASTTSLVDGGVWPVPLESRTSPGAPVWTLRVPPTARILEIRTAADWAALVTAHPLPLTDRPEPMYDMTLPAGLVGVDWPSAARDWDGVRFPLDGILRAAYVALPVPGGVTAFMPWDAGWERTLWLRWVFTEAVAGPAWKNHFDPNGP